MLVLFRDIFRFCSFDGFIFEMKFSFSIFLEKTINFCFYFDFGILFFVLEILDD